MLLLRESRGKPSQSAALDGLPSSVWVGRQGHNGGAFCPSSAFLGMADLERIFFREENGWR